MVRFLIAFLACLCLVGAASAQCAKPFVYHAPIIKEQVVVKEVIQPVVQRFQAVVPLVELPTYSVAYAQPVVPVAPAPTAHPPGPDVQQQILSAVNGMRASVEGLRQEVGDVRRAQQEQDARLRALEGKGGPQPPQPPAKPPQPPDPFSAPQKDKAPPAANNGLSLLQNRCASCHEAKSAAAKGGGFTMFDGAALAPLTREQRFETLKQVGEGRMPKRGDGRQPLADSEYELVAQFIMSLK